MALTANTKLFEISRKISIDEVLVHSHWSISRQLVYYIGSHSCSMKKIIDEWMRREFQIITISIAHSLTKLMQQVYWPNLRNIYVNRMAYLLAIERGMTPWKKSNSFV